MTHLTRERVKAAIDELPEKYQGNASWYLDRNNETIRQALSERGKLLECIRDLAQEIKWLSETSIFPEKHADAIALARESGEK